MDYTDACVEAMVVETLVGNDPFYVFLQIARCRAAGGSSGGFKINGQTGNPNYPSCPPPR
jgi:hypothetical protein